MAACWLLAMPAATPVQAQVGLTVNVPFSFEMGAKSLPAGHYRIDRPNLAGTSVLYLYSTEKNEKFAISSTPLGNPAAFNNPRLVFERLAGSYRLAEIWMPGSHPGAALPRTEQQTLVARSQGKIETVVIAATR
jgi:hypothetical protein